MKSSFLFNTTTLDLVSSSFIVAFCNKESHLLSIWARLKLEFAETSAKTFMDSLTRSVHVSDLSLVIDVGCNGRT